MKTCINSEARTEFDVRYDARIQKVREAAAAAIRRLSELRSVPITREALDTEVARIGQQNLHRYGCDLIVDRTVDGVARFLIKVQSTGRRYDLIRSFFHRYDALIPRAEV
jgi:hypothetical protein